MLVLCRDKTKGPRKCNISYQSVAPLTYSQEGIFQFVRDTFDSHTRCRWAGEYGFSDGLQKEADVTHPVTQFWREIQIFREQPPEQEGRKEKVKALQ